MDDTNVGIGIVLPNMPGHSDYGREATLIEGITFDSIRMTGIYAHPVRAAISPSAKTRVAAVRDIRFSNIHATGLQFPYVMGRAGNPFRDFVFSNCSFRKVTDAELPDWTHHGAAAWQRSRQEKFEYAEGFVYDNVRFDAGTALSPLAAPCEAISRSGSPLGWFKRDAAHNDDAAGI